MHSHRSMKQNMLFLITVIVLLLFLVQSNIAAKAGDPLPSWTEGSNKQTIIDFVTKATNEDDSDFIPAKIRIATFDNDGTLWSEQPLYFQAIYIFDRIKELAPDHPDWQQNEPYASVLKGDFDSALSGGKKALLEMVMGTHAGVTASDFSKSVADWLATARHPDSGKSYTSLVYKPMLELLDYLRAHDFKVFIVSGGGID
ncbi:MAG: HAD family hydrolase, partial [Desulfocapsaceae bacterium]